MKDGQNILQLAISLNASRTDKDTKGVRKGGGVGVNPPLEFAMLQKRHYLCKGVCVCFRTFFACLMST